MPGLIQHPAKGQLGWGAPALPHHTPYHPILSPSWDCRGSQRHCLGSPHHGAVPRRKGARPYALPGAGAGCAVCQDADEQGLQAAEHLLSLRARAHLEAEKGEDGARQRLFLSFTCGQHERPPSDTGHRPRRPPPACTLTFLETLLQGVGEGEAALQQELGQGFGGQGQAEALQCRLPRLGAARDRGTSRAGVSWDGARPCPWLAVPAGAGSVPG